MGCQVEQHPNIFNGKVPGQFCLFGLVLCSFFFGFFLFLSFLKANKRLYTYMCKSNIQKHHSQAYYFC